MYEKNDNTIYDRFIKRPLSYSQLSSWEWDKEEWYQQYIRNKPRGKNSAMNAGNIIGDSIGTPHSLVPNLTPPGTKEFALNANLNGIYIVGYADHFCPVLRELHENKTSTNRKRWTQGTADKHKQFDMYCLMLALKHDIAPEDVTLYLNYIPVIEGQDMKYYLPNPAEYSQFRTYRTTEQITAFAKFIENTVADMHRYTIEREAQDGIMKTPTQVGN